MGGERNVSKREKNQIIKRNEIEFDKAKMDGIEIS